MFCNLFENIPEKCIRSLTRAERSVKIFKEIKKGVIVMSKAILKARDLLAQSVKDDLLAADIAGFGDCGTTRPQKDSFVDCRARGNAGAAIRVFVSACGSANSEVSPKSLADKYEIWLDSAVCSGDEEYKNAFVSALKICDGAVFCVDGNGENLPFVLNFAIQYAWEQNVPFFVAADEKYASAIKEKFSSVQTVTDINAAVFDKTRASREECGDAVCPHIACAIEALSSGKTDEVVSACEKIRELSKNGKSIRERLRKSFADELCAEAYIGEKKYADAAKFFENAASSGCVADAAYLRAAAVLRRETGSLREAAQDLEKALESDRSDEAFDLMMLSSVYSDIRNEEKSSACRENAKKAAKNSRIASAWVSGNARKIDRQELCDIPSFMRAAYLYEQAFMKTEASQCLSEAMSLAKKAGDSETAALCARRLRDVHLIDGCAKSLAYSKKACESDECSVQAIRSKRNLDIWAHDLFVTGLISGSSEYLSKAADIWNESGSSMSETASRFSKSGCKRQTKSFDKESKKRVLEKRIRDLGKLRIPLLLLAIVVGIAALAGLTCGVKEVHEIIVEARTHTTTAPQVFTISGRWQEYDRLEATVDAVNLEFEWRFTVESEKAVILDWGDGKTSRLKPGKSSVRQKMTSTHIDIIAEEDVVIIFDDGTKFDSSTLSRPPKPTTTTKPRPATVRTTTTTTAPAQITYRISNVRVYCGGELTGLSLDQSTVKAAEGHSAAVSVSGIPKYDAEGNPTGETGSIAFTFTPSENGSVALSGSGEGMKECRVEFTIEKIDG